jgi:(2Fe-2S) ferredoxin
MAKLKKGDLDKLRKEHSKPVKCEIVVSMGTCGIAAGGNDVMAVFEKELKEKGLNYVTLKKTGCMGMCFCEPNLMVKMEGMPDILYGNVDAKLADLIITEHIMKKKIVNQHIIFMPSKDVGKKMIVKE